MKNKMTKELATVKQGKRHYTIYGGSWLSYGEFMPSDQRSHGPPDYQDHCSGFRLVFELIEQHYTIRGGSWNDDGGLARSARRDRYSPGYRVRSIGFRLVFEASYA